MILEKGGKTKRESERERRRRKDRERELEKERYRLEGHFCYCFESCDYILEHIHNEYSMYNIYPCTCTFVTRVKKVRGRW